ncbi:uncharacterized protein MELLADRAFT_63411 [Melampsora larici-populina 98AG31]|uniref:Uncharacterized protein n=1 Tax=Melampsora larici-populina (strain 98AG31 / pathotype 3-4-7) TaxID=747676 RepID=F4RMJ4_MELLP|nr:uncharacterized protein MELLADRAFT_63411 [Melampsora larici-populina 98AG31]EGG06460.1 hypothetical protein MELLADRAFT_63411 [Melampsora larici-populina 98AG31]
MHGSSFTNTKNASSSASSESNLSMHRTSSGTESSSENSMDTSFDSLEAGFTITRAAVQNFSSASARRVHLSNIGKSALGKKAPEKVTTRTSRSISLSGGLPSPHQMASSGLWHIKPTQPLAEPSNPIPIYQCREMCTDRAAPPNKMKQHGIFQGSSLAGDALDNKISPGEPSFIDKRAPLISLEDAQKREKLRRDLSMASIKPTTVNQPVPKSEATPLRSLARRLSVFSHTRPKINWSSNQPDLPNRPQSGKKRATKGKVMNGESVKIQNIQMILSAQSCCSHRSDLISIVDAQRQERERRRR